MGHVARNQALSWTVGGKLSGAKPSPTPLKRLDMLTNRVDIRLAVARECRVLARDDANLHVLIHIERNRDDARGR